MTPAASSICQPAMLLLGPTGAGKTPLGEHLGRHGFAGRKCFHFDFGENLRQVDTGLGAECGLTGEEGAVVRAVLHDGALLEDRQFPIAGKILDRFMQSRGVTSSGWLVLNGLPRHAGQADAIAAWLDVQLVVSLQCPAEIVRRRVAANAGGDRVGRADDSAAEVERKLAIFHDRTAPLLDHYRRIGVTIAAVPVGERTTPIDVVKILKREYGSTYGHHR
jgi:adenylate kinase